VGLAHSLSANGEVAIAGLTLIVSQTDGKKSALVGEHFTTTTSNNLIRGLRPPNLKNKITMKNKKNKPLKFKQVRINYGDYTKLVLVADKEEK